MNADLNDLSYLYKYGDFISNNEIDIAGYLNGLDQSVIDGMADTFVQGYVRGFEIYKIDLSAKKNVQIRANIGFERVIRAAIQKFEALGLQVIIFGDAIHSISKGNNRSGFHSCQANPQFDYDHRMDKGLYLDKALCERIVGVTKTAYEEYKALASVYAGPAVMEVFGEIPFEPVAKETNVKLTEKQEKLAVRLTGQQSEIVNQYINASTTSFTIIAWPLPSIGNDFGAIMDETIIVNNLDNDLYRGIQQKMIDAMDGAAYVHITGMNGNKTDLKVALWQLQNPDAETVFENCCADVNIPVGEIFTSPVLTGTEGILNVSGVYLNELNYRNLTLTFKDGCIAEYNCSNYEDEAKNKAYIKQNLLQNRETLPMGEFAIGTNTTAYAMARRFGISSRMPILIMEKTGPHFAVGDTCYSHSEDHKVYNPDGKEIVARENELSRLRDTDMEKAYFNTHTDITIPYDEIGAITACFANGREVDIIRNGRFCLPGTEKLNEAIETIH
jgi:leucyl aminopeptidase (aminopeptidase T)